MFYCPKHTVNAPIRNIHRHMMSENYFVNVSKILTRKRCRHDGLWYMYNAFRHKMKNKKKSRKRRKVAE